MWPCLVQSFWCYTQDPGHWKCSPQGVSYPLPCTPLKWVYSCSRVAQVLSHIEQVTGLSTCTFLCFVRLLLWVNCLSQTSHPKGFTTLCTFMCLVSSAWKWNPSIQYPQKKVGAICSIWCFYWELYNVYCLPQIAHGNMYSGWSWLIWMFTADWDFSKLPQQGHTCGPFSLAPPIQHCFAGGTILEAV